MRRGYERTGRPLGEPAFLDRVEDILGRIIRPAKPGRKPNRQEKQVCCPDLDLDINPSRQCHSDLTPLILSVVSQAA
jgi:hypothetical protein